MADPARLASSGSPSSMPSQKTSALCHDKLCRGVLDLARDTQACRVAFDTMLRKLTAVQVLAATISTSEEHQYVEDPLPASALHLYLQDECPPPTIELGLRIITALTASQGDISDTPIVLRSIGLGKHGDAPVKGEDANPAAPYPAGMGNQPEAELLVPAVATEQLPTVSPTTTAAPPKVTCAPSKAVSWKLNATWEEEGEPGSPSAGIDDDALQATLSKPRMASLTSAESALRRASVSQTERTLGFQVLAPDSVARISWDMAGLGVFLAEVILVPLQAFMDNDGSMPRVFLDVYRGVSWFCILYWALSIPVGFASGYVNKHGDMELSPRKAASHYVRTWLFFDVALVSSDIAFIYMDRPESLAGRGLRALRFLTFIRTIKMNRVFERTAGRSRGSEWLVWLNLVKWFFVMLTVIHVVGCSMYGIGAHYTWSSNSWIKEFKMESRSFGYRYLTSAHWSLSQFAATKNEIRPTNTLERFFTVATGAVAVILNPWMVSKITTSLVGLQVLKRDFTEKQQKLRKYLRKHNISREVRGRIWKMVSQQTSSDDHCHQGNVELLQNLPAHTRAALRLELFHPVMTCFPFFMHWMWTCHDAHVVYDLVTEVLGELFVAKGQHVFGKGEIAQRAYFLTFGLVQYTTAGLALREDVKPRSLLCEQALWLDWTHTGTATAQEDTDLFTIHAAAFQRNFAEVHFARIYASRFHTLALQGQSVSEVCDRDLAEGLAEYASGQDG